MIACPIWYIDATLIPVNPDSPINDIADFLDCFDTNQNATLTIYALEPNPGSGDTSVGRSVGHAFISISQGNSTSVYGYYPAGEGVSSISPNDNGVLGNDQGEHYNISISNTVSGNTLNQILNYIQNHHNSPYNLNTYNCTDFGIDIGNLAGMNLPSSDGTWPKGGGSNPGALGENIRNNNTSGVIINNNGGNASQNHKGC